MPEDAETLLNLGNAHKMLRQMHEALVSYRRALAVREDFAGAWFNMGYLLEEMGDSQQAMAAYHRAAALDPAFAAKASAYRKTLVGKP
jgi:tetratricopeptide (TPR) repeat protein